MKVWIYEALCSTLATIRRRLVAEGFTDSVDLLDRLQESVAKAQGEAIE